MTPPSSVVVEADGGSRGNPGPSAYGAVLKDAQTGAVIAQRGETIGVATNNVAEYRALIAGLELAAEHAPGAEVEVRMDSRLVVEQMSGTWKIKHPEMKPLAARARALAPTGTTYTWVPRAQNTHADSLVNAALDDPASPLLGAARPVVDAARPVVDAARPVVDAARPVVEPVETTPAAQAPAETARRRGWAPPGGPPTTLILVRHGVTDHTLRKLFSGGLKSANPPLNEEGRAQIRATAEWLSPMRDEIDALVSSPVRRTHESAEILAEVLEKPIALEEGIAEMEFGSWDGMSYAEINEKFPDDMADWLGDLEYAPGGGESFRSVEKRVLAGRDRIVSSYAGRTVVAVSHVTPIKTLVADALKAPLEAVYRMELAPASVSVVSYFQSGPDGEEPMANLRLFNARPIEAPFV